MTEEYQQLERRILEAMHGPFDFAGMALEIFRFQFRNNAPYRQYCLQLGAGESPCDWTLIPAVPQAAFKRIALRSFPAEETNKTFRTSGTTGEGYGEHHFANTRLYDAAILAGWDRLELPRLRQIILTPPPGDAPYSSLSHMMGVLNARTDAQEFCMELGDRVLASDQPVLLLGTALAFLHLFESGKARQLPPGSYAMETGGYKGTGRTLSKEELYRQFEEHLGLPADHVINEYGMTELSSQFYTRGLGCPHTGGPWVRGIVMDPATNQPAAEGVTGVLKIVDLANLGSVLAIQTQDLAVAQSDGSFILLGRDPGALPRGCSRAADEMLTNRPF